MAFIVRIVKTLRNNWKKSTFAAVAITYAYGYTKEYFQTQELMRIYCEKAARYGEQPIPVDVEPRNITVILNPSANKRKASDEFEKYCAPILHVAGICVDIIKTESEGHARNLINSLENTDAIVVAGGDGTLSEVITGLVRRTQENTYGLIPLGILPLGKTNSFANILFPLSSDLVKVRALADATMAVVEEVVRPIDVLKIEVMESENKPIYAVSGIKWGAFRDAESKKDSYWFYGSLRKYATYLFNGYKSNLTWDCNADISYTPPCYGCSNCAKSQDLQKRWFQRFSKDQQPNVSNVLNPECQNVQQKDVSTIDLSISVSRLSNNQIPKLEINIGPSTIDYLNFIREGWRSENGHKRNVQEMIEARSVEIHPVKATNNKNEAWFSIDNENYELKPVKVTILPRLIKIFCKQEDLQQ